MFFRRTFPLFAVCLFAAPVFSQQLSNSVTPPIDAPASKAPIPLPDVAPPTEAELLGLSPVATPVPIPAPTSTPTPKIASVELKRPPDTFGQTPAEIYPWLENVATARPDEAKLKIIGESATGASIVALELTPPGKSPWNLKRLVVICRQHGNEPEATGSATRLIYHWLKPRTEREKNLAAKTALLIVPIANPDGAARYERRTAKNVDMNRDWGRNQSKEVQVLTKWIGAWKPHLVIDNHQWLPARNMPPAMAEASGGERARNAARTMSSRSAQRGFALSARSRSDGLNTLAHRYWGRRFNTPAVLLETRHQPDKSGARSKALAQAEAALWGAAESIK